MNSELELTVVERINAEHHACEAGVRAALKHAIRCGALLEEQKAAVGHGEWLGWLEQNFDGSVRVAQTYMRLSRNPEAIEKLANTQSSAYLSIDGALRALASPREPDALSAPDELTALEDRAMLRASMEKTGRSVASNLNNKSSLTPVELEKVQKIKIGKKEYSPSEVEKLVNSLRDEIKEAKDQKAEAGEEEAEAREKLVQKIEAQFTEEMARVKAKYDDEEEPTYAEIPPEAWAAAFRNAKSQRVMNVASHLNDLYTWPEWMGQFFPDEAAEAIMDMEGRESLIEGIEFIRDWLVRVLHELEYR